MAQSVFAKVWRESEAAYSGVLAQTLGLSAAFRRLFLSNLSTLATSSSIRAELQAATEGNVVFSIETEKYLNSASRIDIYAECGNCLSLGIENKTTAGLGKNQLHRYQDHLRNASTHFLLIFLTPSSYALSDEELSMLDQERFVRLSYKQIIESAKEYLKTPDLSEFERNYFTAFGQFTGELEMKPFSNEELGALIQHNLYRTALDKATATLSGLGKVERQPSMGYLLVRKEGFPGFSLYLGFRFGIDWYFKIQLLSGGPEVVVYVKDEEANIEKAENVNRHLQQVADTYDDALEARFEYFPRLEQDECRLVLRRSLSDFVEKDPKYIIDWIKQASYQIEKVLHAART